MEESLFCHARKKHEKPVGAMGCYPTKEDWELNSSAVRRPHPTGKPVGVHASACECDNNPAVAGLNSNLPGLRFQT
jgi:hypothetical protein